MPQKPNSEKNNMVRNPSKLQVENEAKERFLSLVRENFPLHDDSLFLSASLLDQTGLQIKYGAPNISKTFVLPSIRFDVLAGHSCDIGSFCIPADSRRQGNGRKLYYCVEEFAKKYGCEILTVTPSGQGRIFWPKMGFGYKDSFGLEKRLS